MENFGVDAEAAEPLSCFVALVGLYYELYSKVFEMMLDPTAQHSHPFPRARSCKDLHNKHCEEGATEKQNCIKKKENQHL